MTTPKPLPVPPPLTPAMWTKINKWERQYSDNWDTCEPPEIEPTYLDDDSD